MTAGDPRPAEPFDRVSRGDVLRWTIAGLVVLGGGWGVAQAVQQLPPPALVIGEPEPAILLDLAPLPAPVAEALPAPEPEIEPEPVAEQPPPPPQETPPVQTPPPVAEPEPPEPVAPELPPEPEPPEPAPEPPPPQVEEPPPVPEPLPEPVEEIAEAVSGIPMPVTISPRLQDRRENTPRTPRPPPRQAEPATPSAEAPRQRAPAAAAATPPTAASTISPQQWQAQALARLDQRKVYPRAAQADGIEGNAVITFSVGASGQIGSIGLARSSGSAILDQAALDTARRASPLPAPPPGLANQAMSATIRFSLR